MASLRLNRSKEYLFLGIFDDLFMNSRSFQQETSSERVLIELSSLATGQDSTPK